VPCFEAGSQQSLFLRRWRSRIPDHFATDPNPIAATDPLSDKVAIDRQRPQLPLANQAMLSGKPTAQFALCSTFHALTLFFDGRPDQPD
jgi:hypothetical protein